MRDEGKRKTGRKILMILWKFSLTGWQTPLSCWSRYHADSGGSPECSSLGLMIEPVLFSLLIGSDFVVYRKRKGVDL